MPFSLSRDAQIPEHRGSDQFGTQGISASRENPFAQRMVRVGLAQESAADILGQIDRF